MKKLLTTAILLIASHQLFTQTNSFPANGEAGIGTAYPGKPLEIVTSPGLLNNDPTILFTSVYTGTPSYTHSGGLSLLTPDNYWFYTGYGTTTNPGDLLLYSNTNGNDLILNSRASSGRLRLITETTDRLIVNPSGKIDFNIGTWNFGAPRIRFEENSGAPVIKLYHHDGTSYTNYDQVRAYPWWIKNSGASGVSSLSFMSGSQAFMGSELVTAKVTFLSTGNVGINQTSPLAKLQVTDGAILANGSTGGTPISGGGTRMMWIPEKGAFRAGRAYNTEWDDVNIGVWSSVLGENGIASGDMSSVLGGTRCIASGTESSVIGGYEGEASGSGASVIGGHVNMASGLEASVIGGVSNIASGALSSVLGGLVNVASGHGSSVLGGQYSTVSGDYSSILGTGTTTAVFENNIDYSFMVGYAGTGPALFVNGGTTNSTNTTQVAIGVNNPSTMAYNRLNVSGSTSIGSTYVNTGAPINGLMVEGAVLIGTTSIFRDGPGGTTGNPAMLSVSGRAIKDNAGTSWTAFSDKRLKKDIKPFEDGLEKLKQINPVRFHYNGILNTDTTKEWIGVIAQEIQKVAPYTVEEGNFTRKKLITPSKYNSIEVADTSSPDGIKKVPEYVPEVTEDETVEALVYDPTAVTYIIINAIKELDKKVASYDSLYSELQRVSVENQEIRLRLATLEEEVAQLKASKGDTYDTFEDVLLEQNNPNPFSETTNIIYFIPERLNGTVELVVANTTNTILQKYSIQKNIPAQQTISAKGLDTGVYVYGIAVNGQIVKSKKMMILK